MLTQIQMTTWAGSTSLGCANKTECAIQRSTKALGTTVHVFYQFGIVPIASGAHKRVSAEKQVLDNYWKEAQIFSNK